MSRSSFLKLERSDESYVQQNSKWDDSFVDKVYEMCKLGSTDQLLAIALDVSITTIQKWKRDKPEFLQAIEKAKVKVTSQVAVAFFLSCTGYDYEEVETLESSDGKISTKTIKKHKCGDPLAQYRYLNLRQRDEWCDEAGRQTGNTNIININNINKLDFKVLNTEEIKLALKLGMQQRELGTGE